MTSSSPQDEHTGVLYGDPHLGGFDQRRIRHISSIQVRNLTPFPVRDAFASALSQPSEQPQFTLHGHLSDDLDVTLSRRRGRKTSVNSVTTLRSMRSEEGGMLEEARGRSAGEPKERKRTGSRASFTGTGGFGTSPNAGRSLPASAAPTIRPGNRNRTSSVVSAIGSSFAATSSFSHSVLSASSALPDNSQKGLEKVIKARLVATFLAITLSSEGVSDSVSQSATPWPPLTPPHSAKEISSHRKGALSSSSISHEKTHSSPLKPITKSTRSTPPRSAATTSTIPHQKTSVKPSLRLNGKLPASSTSTASRKLTTSPPINPELPSPTTHEPLPKVPNYLSPVHRPSTNPVFPIDAGHEFSHWSDLSGDRLKIEVWGNVELGWQGDGNGSVKGKGKDKEGIHGSGMEYGEEWKVLEEWNISLADLVPLPTDLAARPSRLPSNTLLVALSPPSQTYYLPSLHSFTRTPTPSTGYNSDPESEVRKVKQAVDFDSPKVVTGETNTEINARSRRRYRGGGEMTLGAGKESVKTARLQDLFKLVDLQSCIIDNSQSLSDVIHEIDHVLEEDVVCVLKREISGRELRLEELRGSTLTVKDGSEKLRSKLESRRGQLRQRKETLKLAKEQHECEVSLQAKREAEIEEARARFSSLQSHFRPTRTTLLTTLSAIFPIDLLSPPDLLYTILDVPLPIPINASDPAPPLTLVAHKYVTEDTVATALGYSAQVVQLLAGYLGRSLIYPVTCIGSRSLIRDGISAMVGPRMFPLFSKGVDTYRFEYGVFLLNKDVEMLMADRELRALDMRHTLPNLKNLLLTLTDGEGAYLVAPRVPNSPISSIGLESPRLESPPPITSELISQENTPSHLAIDSSGETSTPPESGATTPTAIDTSKKPRAFLNLYPLTGFLRSRYPPGRPSVKLVPEISEENQDIGDAMATKSDDGSEDDEEDRRTVRGVIVDTESESEGKKVMNGHGHGVEEKLVDGKISLHSPQTASQVS